MGDVSSVSNRCDCPIRIASGVVTLAGLVGGVIAAVGLIAPFGGPFDSIVRFGTRNHIIVLASSLPALCLGMVGAIAPSEYINCARKVGYLVTNTKSPEEVQRGEQEEVQRKEQEEVQRTEREEEQQRAQSKNREKDARGHALSQAVKDENTSEVSQLLQTEINLRFILGGFTAAIQKKNINIVTQFLNLDLSTLPFTYRDQAARDEVKNGYFGEVINLLITDLLKRTETNANFFSPESTSAVVESLLRHERLDFLKQLLGHGRVEFNKVALQTLVRGLQLEAFKEVQRSCEIDQPMKDSLLATLATEFSTTKSHDDAAKQAMRTYLENLVIEVD